MESLDCPPRIGIFDTVAVAMSEMRHPCRERSPRWEFYSWAVIRFAWAGGVAIQVRVTCPHCWNAFPLDQTLWIAEHPDLVGDARLGADQPQRFLPTRFDLQGAALDARHFACHGLACPKCHLVVPRSLFEMAPEFFSILGAPACGTSYFLASMTWRLRKVLPKYFSLSFNDADPALNHLLHEYESLQFLNPKQDEFVTIEKTQEQAGRSVRHGSFRRPARQLYCERLKLSGFSTSQEIGQTKPCKVYPHPFMFSVAPLEGHPNHGTGARIGRRLNRIAQSFVVPPLGGLCGSTSA